MTSKFISSQIVNLQETSGGIFLLYNFTTADNITVGGVGATFADALSNASECLQTLLNSDNIITQSGIEVLRVVANHVPPDTSKVAVEVLDAPVKDTLKTKICDMMSDLNWPPIDNIDEWTNREAVSLNHLLSSLVNKK